MKTIKEPTPYCIKVNGVNLKIVYEDDIPPSLLLYKNLIPIHQLVREVNNIGASIDFEIQSTQEQEPQNETLDIYQYQALVREIMEEFKDKGWPEIQAFQIALQYLR